MAEVVLLARILLREQKREQVMDHGDLGNPAAEDALRDSVQEDRRSVAPETEPERRLAPDQPRRVPGESALRPDQRGNPPQGRAQADQRLQVGGVDDQPRAKRVERPDEAQRVLAEPRGALAKDRGVNHGSR